MNRWHTNFRTETFWKLYTVLLTLHLHWFAQSRFLGAPLASRYSLCRHLGLVLVQEKWSEQSQLCEIEVLNELKTCFFHILPFPILTRMLKCYTNATLTYSEVPTWKLYCESAEWRVKLIVISNIFCWISFLKIQNLPVNMVRR